MSETKNLGLSLSLLLFTFLFGFQPVEPALACSTGSGSFGHGSSLSSGSVTVCVGTNESTPGSSTRTTTTTNTETKNESNSQKKKAKPKKKTAVKKPAPKPVTKSQPAPKKEVETCPTKAQLGSMPRSADAAERWVSNLCNPSPSKPVEAAPKVKSKKKQQKTKKTTTTTTIVSTSPSRSSNRAEASFTPQPLRSSYRPERVLQIGESATFIAFPTLHIKNQLVLGRRAEVQFTPELVSWKFSDGTKGFGSELVKSFGSKGQFAALANVSYSVSYRILGASSWEKLRGLISVSAAPLQVTVAESAIAPEDDSSDVLLVGQPCTPGKQSFGCGD